jgi:ubiquinone/menaquinone biosynthesis C-methylase UbiE
MTLTDTIRERNRASFYEGKFTRTKDLRFRGGGAIGRLYRCIAMDYSIRRARFLEKHLAGHDNTILDLGCGGGTILFTEYGKVIGVDLSLGSLRAAKSVYDLTLQVDISHLPFKDCHFDYVVSIDVLGHIPVEQKDTVLQEIKRVLKPTGQSIHAAIETDGTDYLSRLARQDSNLYQEIFVRQHGHFGYEYPSQVIERFRQNGYHILDHAKIQGGLFVDPWFYVEWFWKSKYTQKSRLLCCLSLCFWAIYALDSRFLQGKGILVAPFKFVLGWVDYVFDKYWLPFDWSRGIAICASKSL